MNNNEIDQDNLAVKYNNQFLIARASKNKRCILAYLNDRMNKLENYSWEYNKDIPEQILSKMDEKDKNYQEQYYNLINKYSKNISECDFDLTKNYQPPKEIYIEVRALQDINNLKTFEGEINVVKNHTYSFRKNDIEHYIRKGLFAINE